MGNRFRADGDTWEAAFDRETHEDGAATLVFHCVSNPQRPYRVVPVPADGGPVEEASRLDERELQALFDRSQVMDFVHDPEADPRNPEPRTTP